MIQDIAPRHLDNQYRNITPDAKDTIFFFEDKEKRRDIKWENVFICGIMPERTEKELEEAMTEWEKATEEEEEVKSKR